MGVWGKKERLPPLSFVEHAGAALLLSISPRRKYSDVIRTEEKPEVSETAKVYIVLEECLKFLDYLAHLDDTNHSMLCPDYTQGDLGKRQTKN